MTAGSEKERDELLKALKAVPLEKVDAMAQRLVKALTEGRVVLVAGNGGSAADAQHLATELVCSTEGQKRVALPAIALTTNASTLTAWSNDRSFDEVFARQVEAYGKKGDILISISTSGNSANILAAMKAAQKKGMTNFLLSGRDGGKALVLADLSVVVPAQRTPRIQECHVFVLHALCQQVEEAFAKN